MKQLITLIMFALISSCYRKEANRTGLEGKPLPTFQLLLTDSTTYFSTNSIPKGKPIVLFDFGPHCPYSLAQMEEILGEMSLLEDINFCIFTTWPFPEMKKFYTHFKLNKYPNITVGFDYTNFFGDYFKSQGVPYIAIYGKDKLLNKTFIGKIYSKQIKEASEE